jgi:molybdopterin-guanine dinucleotide biosynthesis protein A
MPFTTEAMALRLFELAVNADVACFTRQGRAEPLFALYRQSLGTRWLGELSLQRSLRTLLGSVRVCSEPVSDERSLDSLNTPEDLQRHRALRKF